MRESAHKIGSATPLFGILTESDESAAAPQRPIILLLNSGLLGRIGPFRLHVHLARHFAALGFKTFRLDLSGIGDSGRHRDSRPRDVQHIDDIAAVIDYLQGHTGATTFITMGICTGADHAHKAIVRDERIVGAICIDGYAYPTARYLAVLYLRKLFRLSSWKTLFRIAFERLGLKSRNPVQDDSDSVLKYRWSLPPREQTRDDYESLISRDARVLCVFTAAWPYGYENQLADAFRGVNLGNNIRVALLRNATHTFKVREDRDVLVDAVDAWLLGQQNADRFS